MPNEKFVPVEDAARGGHDDLAVRCSERSSAAACFADAYDAPRMRSGNDRLRGTEEGLRTSDGSVRGNDERLGGRDERFRPHDEGLRILQESLRGRDEGLRIREESLGARDQRSGVETRTVGGARSGSDAGTVPVNPQDAKSFLTSDAGKLPPVAEALRHHSLNTIKDETNSDELKPQVYVSQSGGDRNGAPGSRSNPFRRIQDAVNSAPSGSVINVGAGTYKERVSIGRSDLVVRTDADRPAVLDLAGQTTGTAEAAFAIRSNVRNIAVRNFEIKNFNGDDTAAIKIDGENIHNVTISGNHLHHSRDAEAIRVYGRGTTDGTKLSGIKLVGNKIHDLQLVGKPGDDLGEGGPEAISISGNIGPRDATKRPDVDAGKFASVIVRGNVGYNNGNIFVDLNGGEGKSKNRALDQPRGALIEFNYSDGVTTVHNKSYGYKQSGAASYYSDGAKDVVFRNNVSVNSERHFEAGKERKGPDATNIRIYNNIGINAKMDWLARGSINTGGVTGTIHDNIIVGNSNVDTNNASSVNIAERTQHYFRDTNSIKRLPAPLADLMGRR